MGSARDTILQVLNPADHFTLAMDEEIRNDGLPGSLCGFALELDSSPDTISLKDRIDSFCLKFPTSRARLKPIGRRFFWCSRETLAPVFFVHVCSGEQNDNDEFHTKITEVMNHGTERDSVSPIEFHLFQGKAKSIFMVRWLHPFCDAVGAGIILKYLSDDELFASPHFHNNPPSLLNEQLNRFSFIDKIKLLLKSKKLIEENDRLESILPVRHFEAPKRLNFRVFQLSKNQSQKVIALSRKYVGITGSSQYYIGCMIRAIDRMETRSAGEAYCIPYAFNLRRQNAISPVTANHVSALFAQVPVEIVHCRKQLFKHLSDQSQNAIRQQLDYAFLPLMWAGQWLSLGKYGKTIRQSYKTGNERSSFWFSDIGQSDLSTKKLFGAPITGIFHACQMTTPPGLGLLTCIFRNRISLTYNFIEPNINTDWVARLHDYFLIELLEESE